MPKNNLLCFKMKGLMLLLEIKTGRFKKSENKTALCFVLSANTLKKQMETTLKHQEYNVLQTTEQIYSLQS